MTPWWVLLLVGVLGIVAAWGAQIISARIESRRRLNERAHEAAAHWRDRRLEVYSDFLRAVEAATESAKRHHGMAVGPGLVPPLSAATNRVADAFAPLELIGTEDAIRLGQQLHVQLLLLELADADTPEAHEAAQTDVRAVESRVGVLRAQLRTDVALGPIEGAPRGWRLT